MYASGLFVIKILLAVFAILVPRAVASQCSTDAEDPPDILGAWEWIDTRGGFDGRLISPETVGHTIQVEFRDSGFMVVFRDLELIQTVSYRLILGAYGWTVSLGAPSPFPHPTLEDLDTGFFCLTKQETTEGVRLSTMDVCADCFWSRYEPREAVDVSTKTWGLVKRMYQD